MESDLRTEKTSGQLGIEAVDRALALAEECCKHESQRVELRSQPRIAAIRCEMAIHSDQIADLEARLRKAGRPGGDPERRRKVLYYGAIALILIVASFFFSIIALDPYRIGWKGWLYCIGIAIVTPFCVEKFLEVWDCRRLVKISATVAFTAAFSSLILLAVIRGSVLAEQVQAEQAPAVEIDSDTSAPIQTQNTFYQDTLILLRLTMALLAVSMELGAGIALHEIRLLGPGSGEDREELSDQLRETKMKIAQLMHESIELSNSAPEFVASFWSHFYRAMLTHTMRKAITGMFLVLLFVPPISRAQAPTGQHLNLVVEIDLSTSVAAIGHDDKTEFEKNIAAITRLLSQVPSDSQVTVLGITENSFSQPYVLLSAKTTGDKGYFGEKLGAARQQILRVWHERSARLQPSAPGTDILGSLVVAGQLLQQTPNAQRKVLAIFSDMREFTRHLNFETSSSISKDAAFPKVDQGKFLPNLKGVEVYILGADAAGQEVVQWDSVRKFWAAYFQRQGANLRAYSMMRPLPEL
jgi:hypothetical protein